MLNDRLVIQAVPEFSRYDSTLFYTLQPGTFIFKNREFANKYQVNSLGLRDDEVSVNFPDIVVTGDSYAMGWGVEQDQTYSSILEKLSGLKVLNTAISSFATDRETSFLKRINTDSIKYFIIQYSDNDYYENYQFLINHNKLKIRNKIEYMDICNAHVKSQKYYFFKNIIHFPKIIAKKLIGRTIGEFNASPFEMKKGYIDEYNAFLRILNENLQLPKNAKIIVFNIDYRKCKPDFIPGLLKNIDNYPDLKSKTVFFNFSKVLNDRYFYILDDHMNADGHLLIATSINNYITKNR